MSFSTIFLIKCCYAIAKLVEKSIISLSQMPFSYTFENIFQKPAKICQLKYHQICL